MKTKRSMLTVALACGLFIGVDAAFAQTWMQTSAPTQSWTSVASSADGSKLVAAVKGGGIYASSDSGSNWIVSGAPNTNWSSISSSADGTKLVAAVSVFSGTQYEKGGPIYVSSDSGVNWAATVAPNTNWSSVASSADGRKLVAVAGGLVAGIFSAPAGPIFTSSDSGATWTATSVTNANCISVASSADGSKLVAVGSGCPNYISSDAGATWIPASDSPFCQASSVASSADGTRLVSGIYGILKPGGTVFYVYTSTNSGATWTLANLFPSQGRGLFAASADGTRLVVAAGANAEGRGGPIVISTNSGVTWMFNGSPSADWSSVASSADGGKLVAAVNGGGIWTLQFTPTPSLNVARANTNLVLSWIVPSTSFVLQEKSDLNTTNWTDVTNALALNFATVQNQVAVPRPTANRFYRLKH